MDNQYGELRQNDPLKVYMYQNDPKLQTYDSLLGAARHTNLTKDLYVAESLVDAVAELVKAVPDLESIFKGDSDPASDLVEDSDEYIALSAISRCYNTLRTVHDNILQPSINYHQVWPIAFDFVAVKSKSNGLKDGDAVKIMASLEGPIAGKAFGGQTLPKNLSARGRPQSREWRPNPQTRCSRTSPPPGTARRERRPHAPMLRRFWGFGLRRELRVSANGVCAVGMQPRRRDEPVDVSR